MLLRCIGLACAWFCAVPAAWPQGGGATITFTYDNPGLHPQHYAIVLHEDGTGTYRATADGDLPAREQSIVVRPPLRNSLFAFVRKAGALKSTCDMNRRNLAFDGTKTLEYAGAGASETCTYIHPKDARLDGLSSDLIAVAYTLEEGRKLELLLLHDRLGLDAELGILVQAQAAEEARQMANIAPVLESIASDEGVLSRARERARGLLTTADPAP